MTIDRLLLALLVLVVWLQGRRVSRLRETLRRAGIVYDPDKPWEGA